MDACLVPLWLEGWLSLEFSCVVVVVVLLIRWSGVCRCRLDGTYK
jgi:hypothetical protein